MAKVTKDKNENKSLITDEETLVALVRDNSLTSTYIECDVRALVPSNQVEDWLNSGNGWKIEE